MHSRRNPSLTISSTSSLSVGSSHSLLSPRISSSRESRGLLSPSPPPSPALPSLIPRHGKRPIPRSQTWNLIKLLLTTCVVVVLAWLGIRSYTSSKTMTAPVPAEGEQGDYEMVGDSSLPRDPSVVMVADKNGKPKWTVSIPQNVGFPLRPTQYAELCSQTMEMSHHMTEATGKKLNKRHKGYYFKDPSFVDILEAEEQGFLPPYQQSLVSDDHGAGENGAKVCNSSLTFVLETSDAGLGNTLLGLWMSYGLAQKEGRAFFVDDTRWAYGNYSTYFAPVPQQSCTPPPASHILPCPHTARHLVISAATYRHHFGHAFQEQFEDAHKMEVQRQQKIFTFLRAGYETLFKLPPDDAAYVEQRVKQIYAPVREKGGIAIGLHIRRGDKHPYEYQYSKDYLPLTRYVDAARDMLIAYFEADGPPSPIGNIGGRPSALDAELASITVLASDDPDVYVAPETSATKRAQDRIVLASKKTLEAASSKTHGSAKKPFVDDVSGWEGGFYHDVFWGLGRSAKWSVAHQAHSSPPSSSAVSAPVDERVPEPIMHLRSLVGRSYLLDLAVLSRADGVVCGVSAVGCRVLGVMKGWSDVGEEGGGWRNVDGEFEWRGLEWK
ncbi:hypothetical protein M501DRAFT_926522 [Patellaria atrata CBS 101060]|uniref:Uncharacterized protein n=1 Tax=Patellaria atrata CBS 101060 TaxID=1346257 RepID=A0A9P4SJ23_9PEZI|nr:hypothetical protein M501DRAFT_926522 [Patellaria atrata CBS 101060]